MRVWSVSELNNVVRSLQPLVGLRLQEIMTGDSDFVLGFYSPEGMLWLWIDLNAVHPALLPWTALPLTFKSVKSPLHLFLKAHFVGHALRQVSRDETGGKVVRLHFAGEAEGKELEIHLFPHRRNLIAKTPDKHGFKKVAWQKPAELKEPPENFAASTEVRDLERLREEWTDFRGQGRKGLKAPADPRVKLEGELAKKRKAMAKVRDELKRKEDLPWREVGDWIKEHQSLDVRREWEPFVDRQRKLAWNIETCYARARETEGKATGTRKRLHSLENEIEVLEKRLSGEMPLGGGATVRPAAQPLADSQAQGRTLRLSDELTAVAGKSAADNMKILRRARAWDLWMHMRDYPSSHAVIFRNKNTKVSENDLQEVARWFVRLHFGNKAAQHSGEKFELILAECRFVKPIKGDKIGRVTYRDERILICRLP